ncbi:MAG: YceH family protein [Verrucomicrobiota bacterium]
MDESPAVTETLLSPLEGRVLGCLIEKEFSTPDIYPLTLNALINACNQRSNRSPVMEVGADEVSAALEGLRLKRLASLFSGADARVPKFRQTLDNVLPVDAATRALLGELLLRGPQTAAALRGNAERLCAMPPVAEVEAALDELAARPEGNWARKLPRQPGQKEARWAQLLTGEPAESAAGGGEREPLKVAMTLPPEAEQRIAALEAEVARLGAALARLQAALGEE